MAELLSAREAATAAGVSERTIRNWISAGKLSAERTSAGFRVRSEDLGNVPTSAATSAAIAGKNGTVPEPSADLSALVDLVRELLPKAEAAAMWQARAEHLANQLEQAQRALPEPTPQIRPQTSDSKSLSLEPTQTPPEARRRPWWRVW